MLDSKQFQRMVNLSHVLQLLRINQGISRIEISKELGLDRSTISNLVNPLIENSIVKVLSKGMAPSKGGRRPVLLGIDENFGSILGIDLQISSYSAVLVNLNGEILQEWSGRSTYLGIVKTMEKLYESLKDEIDSFSIPLIGIGVGIPAMVDTEKGFILKATSLNCHNFDFKNAFKDFFPVPVLIDNDANCCAWGQLEKNKDKKLQNFLNIIWKLHRQEGESAPEEIEIGMGVVLKGEVYYGSGFSAGELPEDLLFQEQGNIYIKTEEGLEIDHLALKIYLESLFQYLIPIFSVFDPQEIIFGGQFAHRRKAVETILEGCGFSISFPEMDNRDTAFGAASMFLEKLFRSPDFQKDSDDNTLQWNYVFRREND